MAENILRAFNGTLDLRAAYSYNAGQVESFLQDVCSNPATYAVPANVQTELQRIRREILRLRSPNGPDYASATLTPNQHIHRTLNPAWPPSRQPVIVSKFKVGGHAHSNLNYWGIFDLLGLFLSTIGGAPTGASKRNFYLPLTAVYGKWCAAVGDRTPYMYQCTWRQRCGQADEFFLGSNLAGYDAPKPSTGTWLYVMRRARFRPLNDEPFKLTGYDFVHAPARRGPQAYNRQRFGTCAETYPFLRLLKGHNPTRETCHGLALQRDFTTAAQYEDNLSGSAWTRVRDPCPNCQVLIRLYGGNLQNFLSTSG
ncbi:hypothetical protein DTO164E3_9136 [Paecilomyces variotii]|nr:hypothetical protein DTO164E3_9136 [Paecilomyces variotii]KAJ9228858.1 hypothetical protein DTO169E5_9050 [Paecilomyces variotii]KAJ9246798.1 hypothetical protein DTO207G8_8606 [Paecilomyces variotii]KAJ9283543.1 hypothetical protein DTO021C3_8876 [Paecilomyces variotii]KAJ9311106.1 hypothetical protein DTO271D3_8644 [Paecilomyces variotii]